MIEVKVKLTGTSRLSFSKKIRTEKEDKESDAQFEERAWREKMHYDDAGNVLIPAMMLKNCISESAKYLSERVAGKGKATWTKNFEAGVMVEDDINLKVKKDKVKGEWVFVPSDGVRGGTKRVDKCFPVIEKGWSGETTVVIIDESITKDIFEKHLKEAGRFIGVGRFRPRKNGIYGRFDAKIVSWEKIK
jgi:hypothetical protein